MKKILATLVAKFGRQLCTLAGMAAVFSTYGCRGKFYQPEEPVGLAEFINSNRK